ASAEAHAVVTKRCVTCHSASGMAGPDYDWTNELSLVAHRRNVAAQVAQGSMPPTGYPRLTPQEKQSLVCWARGI
ncbi:MAG TPA: c-type cytochrome, partial [Polyangiaceae bacterium]|nr:c-type cytochrome [Polyangiaceae bacterium]